MAAASALRPAEMSIKRSGLAGSSWNRPAASSRVATTVSVMRSNRCAATAARVSASSDLRPRSRPFLQITVISMPRSMRWMCVRPQLCAMSVALLAHGEIVPKRGITTKRSPSDWSANGAP
ncbi:hypothetical protein D9M69_589890 [compost metagenome]